MPKFFMLLTAGCILLITSVYSRAVLAEEIGVAPFVAYGVSGDGSQASLGAVVGGDYVRFALAVSQYEGADTIGFPRKDQVTFTNLDVSARVGMFSDVSLYAEVGFAMDELLVDDLFEGDDSDNGFNNSDDEDRQLPDPFLGVAGGFEQKHWSLTAFARYRYLPSYEEEYLRLTLHSPTPVDAPDVHQIFTGVEFSLRF
jgi:hypothetical protein